MHKRIKKVRSSVKGLLRSLIAFFLYVTGLLYILDFLLTRRQASSFVIFVAHRVVGDGSSPSASLERGFVKVNYGLDIHAFEKRLRYILRRFRIAAFAEIVQHVRDGSAFSGRRAAITVDDGYSECYSHLYPLFQKYNVPATLFITTGVIETGKIFWFDKLTDAFLGTRASCVRNNQIHLHENIARSAARLEVFRTALLRLSKLQDEERERVVEELCAMLGNTDHRKKRLYLTWDEIKQMAQSVLVTVGSHTVSHSNLSKADLESAKREIEQSAALIEQCTSVPVQFLAYPGGAFTPSVVEWLRTTKILGACTSSIGVETDPYRLRRFDIAQQPFFLFAFDISELNRLFRGWKARRKQAKK